MYPSGINPTTAQIKLANNGLIDQQGVPQGKFKDFVKQCLSGTPGLLYKFEIPEDGSSDGKTNECLPGHGTAFEGETMQLATAYKIDVPQQSNLAWWQKILGRQPVYAADAGLSGLVTDTDYMTAWLGYVDDSRDMANDIDGIYPNEVNNTSTNTSSTVVPTGSATIGSFKMPDITYDKANITLPACDFTGAQPPNAVRGEQPGAKELQKLVNDRYGQGGVGFIFNCRAMTGNPTEPSVHGTGRAVDSYFNALNATEVQKGSDALGWLVANAKLFGVQYAKFWRVAWSPQKGFHCVTDKADQGVHSTHVHFEVNWDGALRKTPYFTGTPFSQTGISVSQDICPVL